ncbi:KUP/HAK/KT family potassium transporter [Companilactobacillus kimchii]|uniref:Probable potassium transport system protein Kup n=2 Tax=Companilactobacillus kimchii TaxID=2801452 RepID=A0ABR5NX42_9LACO|nr:KUP/HAK/KT family potassium transporter [Companilactobacillus kimchii]KAE9559946.1 potassium transporter Kup [Companilactobacillus kimchii]KRK53461.1 potassium uptake protein [Companilactobacillus kimchii DSM 13961 = JCM 10707]OWF33488.1 putative potassium transport system protein kup [Companilactobacillus kimchii]GEO46568.1 putative potassium transport system protein kup 2 [Companilactobacillus paralimentarius]
MEKRKSSFSLLGMLITLGIVYGDIGTSPLYVMNSIINDAGTMADAKPEYILGSVSLIFWTLMLITTIKYVLIAMKADNNEEGGIFALYALVRTKGRWLIIPALIGGSALLADGTLTPAVTVTSAIEGIKGQQFGNIVFSSKQSSVLIIVTVILLTIFIIQKSGTDRIGRSFGPIMFIWFSFIGIAGFLNLTNDLSVLKALSPVYAIEVLFSPVNKVGIFILGSVFLATTGAEALYADMGQVGKHNVYATWPYVYAMLMLNYFGQAAWVINNYQNKTYNGISGINPFYEMLPGDFKVFAIVIATMAAIIASQALITGSFTLVQEAIGLKILPRLKVKFPGKFESQLYIGTINWMLCAITIGIVWGFGSSEHMESAYGLAITLTMLMTTVLLHQFLIMKKHRHFANIFMVFFIALEGLFLLSSLIKFVHGGYVTVIITCAILAIMIIWYFGNKRRDAYLAESENVSLLDYLPQLEKLSKDSSIPTYATNLVYMIKLSEDYTIKRSVIYSILDQTPKRARVYWFITVNQTNAPYECNYTVDMMHTRNVVNVHLNLGFKKSQHVNIYIRQIINALIRKHIIDDQTPNYSMVPNRHVGSFKFIIQNQQFQDLGAQEQMNSLDRLLIGGRLLLQNITISPSLWFGLEFSDVVEEKVPLFLGSQTDEYLTEKELKNDVKS